MHRRAHVRAIPAAGGGAKVAPHCETRVGCGRLLTVAAIVIAACRGPARVATPVGPVVSAPAEARIGDAEAKHVEAEMGTVEAPALVAYVRAVGARLAAASPRRDVAYTFNVLDRPEPNAFALPGGHVYVTRGLLVLLNAEDELAGVLGHEIGHVAGRDAMQGASAAYSREQEREADRVGQTIAAAAGWDPTGIARALETIERVERLGRERTPRPSFLDSHPHADERVERVTAFAGALARHTADRLAPDAFVRRLDGLVVGDDVSHGVLDGRVFRHPALGFQVRFPEGWAIESTRTQVGASGPQGTIAVLVTVAASGDDPLAGVRALEAETKEDVASAVRRTTVDGRRALRASIGARVGGRGLAVELAWIALGGRVVQIAGTAPAGQAEAARPHIVAVIDTFRPLTSAERARVRQTRLRLETARAGDTAAAIAERAPTPWTPEMVAAANGAEADAPLPAGRLVKIARSESY